MVYILGGPGDEGPLGTRVVSGVARKHNVPVIVDAAAEILTLKPNVHLERGANAVAYSGGKCMRGPQAAGLLLGEKKWLQGAWINSAPHHAFGRSLKAGKEEIMGMLAAVEMWVKRDHKAEWAQWESWLRTIADSAQRVPGVEAKMDQGPDGLSNRSPSLTLRWDGARLGITGQELSQILRDSEPRIFLAEATGSHPGNMASSVSFVPYQMSAGEEKIVAERIYSLLSKPPHIDAPRVPQGSPADVAGQWDVHLEFNYGSADHTLIFEQHGANLAGTHHGEFASGDLTGSVAANTVSFRSSIPTEGTRVAFHFTGTVENGRMSGVAALGEYGKARWTGRRHSYAKSPVDG